jgi:hypothetical protein
MDGVYRRILPYLRARGIGAAGAAAGCARCQACSALGALERLEAAVAPAPAAAAPAVEPGSGRRLIPVRVEASA